MFKCVSTVSDLPGLTDPVGGPLPVCNTICSEKLSPAQGPWTPYDHSPCRELEGLVASFQPCPGPAQWLMKKSRGPGLGMAWVRGPWRPLLG